MTNKNCTFCQIAEGNEKSFRVFESDSVYAFMDKHPIHPGHILVIPKNHDPDFYNLNNKIYTELMNAVKMLSKIVKERFNPKKVGLVVAGFDIPHAHVHIIPMHDYHDITSKSLLEGKKSNPKEEELVANAEKVRQSMKE